MEKRYVVENLAEIAPVPCPCGMTRRALVNTVDGAASYHVVAIKKDAQLHYHKERFEIYHVLEGTGVMELDGDRIPVGPGSVIFIGAYCRHRAVGQLTVANVSVPGFDPRDEWFD